MSDILPPASDEITPTRVTSANLRDYALVGVAFGLAFPMIATTFLVAQQRLPWSLESLMAVQAANPLLWMIDSAPLFLGTLAAMAGLRQDTLADRNLELIDRERLTRHAKGPLRNVFVGRLMESKGVLELASDLMPEEPELAWMEQVSVATGRPITFALLQNDAVDLIRQFIAPLLPFGAEGGKLLDIAVLDHIVVASARYTSLKERGLGFGS